MQIVYAMLGLGVGAVVLFVVVIIVSKVDAAAPTLTGIANTTYMTVKTQAYQAIQMAPIVLIVVVAGAIITILIGAFVINRR